MTNETQRDDRIQFELADPLERILFVQYAEHRAVAMQVAQLSIERQDAEHALAALHVANTTALQLFVALQERADVRAAQARRFPVQPNDDPSVPELDA